MKKKPHRVSFRAVIDKETFEHAKEILNRLDLTIGEVIGLLCKQIVLHRKLPFEIKDREENVKVFHNHNGDLMVMRDDFS